MEPVRRQARLRLPVRSVTVSGQVVYTQQSMFGMVQKCTALSGLRRQREPLSRISVRTATEPVIHSPARRIKVSIPAGIDNGQSVRIRGKGEPGTNGGERGDLLVEVIVSQHPIFKRQDTNIYSTVPISFVQAALGGTLRIKTVDGEVEYQLKAGTQTDTTYPSERQGSSFPEKPATPEAIIM